MLIIFPFLLLFFFFRDLFVIICLLFLSVFVGMFVFSFELLSRVDGLLCVVLVVFLPVTMLIGVGIGFGEIFCETAPEYFGKFFKDSCEIVCS